MIDEAYEFRAPRFFDFTKEESDEDKNKAELWFDSALAYAPSPFMPRIKAGRSFTVETMCAFTQADQMQNVESSSVDVKCQSEITLELKDGNSREEAKEVNSARQVNLISADKSTSQDDKVQTKCTKDEGRVLASGVSSNKRTVLTSGKENSNPVVQVGNESSNKRTVLTSGKENSNPVVQVGNESCTPKPHINSKKGDLLTDSKENSNPHVQVGNEACTPKPHMNSKKGDLLTDSKKIDSLYTNPSVKRQKSHLQSSQKKYVKPDIVTRELNVKNATGTPSLAQENQAIKRQKLDGGRSRQILNLKPQTLPHKSKLGYIGGTSSTALKNQKEDRMVYVREPAAPFVSMAEMMNRFQSSTRDMSLPHMKPKLTLTRPKEPEFETSQRVRSVKVKSTAELEEEMMAKIPKFKARPVNKKILAAPSLPVIPRSTPQPPEFKEFHLKTMARASQNTETASEDTKDVTRQSNHPKPHQLTDPKTPVLHTSLRARPPRVKSSWEIEQEELEKIPKFKAKPLNKKIFESKGDLGMSCNVKKHVTKPQEFHFATDARIPPPAAAIFDLFDKLSLNSFKSEPQQNPIPRNTMPNPFHLHTEERGLEKERKFFTEVMQKKLEEEKARVPKANPYPYTTDYPVIPPKPEPKQCTKPEPFQLESLTRHEEEMEREMEERRRMEMQEAQIRLFKAQPILKEDPIPVPEKVRMPLTEVQEFNLNVNHRAVYRAEFDQKVKQKEMIYKRYREETEAAKMLEEEKALKQLRRTLVPHARPVPNFERPFCPQKCPREVTKAKSPNLRVLQRKERRRMTVYSASAAAQMR